ncbi:MAG: Crp/Fnr family transcriptional regulator [Acidimicrobiales bacterium]
MPANPLFTEFLCRSDLRLDAVSASALGAAMWPVQLRASEFLFHQGDPCDHFYVVYEGRVDVQATSIEGQELLFTTLHPGAPIGEATIVSGEQRTASIRARDNATLLAIDRVRFLQLAHEHPEISLTLARLAAQTLRRLSTRVEREAFADLDVRLVELLDSLVSATSAGVGRVEVQVTQAALGMQLGVSRESVNKHLGRLAARGLIELGRGRVIVLDAAQFHDLATG